MNQPVEKERLPLSCVLSVLDVEGLVPLWIARGRECQEPGSPLTGVVESMGWLTTRSLWNSCGHGCWGFQELECLSAEEETSLSCGR